MAAATSAPTSASRRTASTCSPPTARTRRAPTSPPAIRSSTTCFIKKLGWWNELTDAEKAAAEGKNWKTDLSGGIIRVAMKNHGCHPFGNAKARAVVWNFPDPIPQHREPRSIRHPSRSQFAKYPTPRRQESVLAPADALYKTRAAEECRGQARQAVPADPDLRSAGRVQKAAARRRARTPGWRVELQQEMFVEIQPEDGGRPRHPRRRAGLGQVDRPARRSRCARSVHRARGQRTPCWMPVTTSRAAGEGRGPAGVLPGAARTRSCAASRSTPRRPTATTVSP